MSSEHRHDGPRLKRQIGLATATALVVGEVVGVGIFLTPAGMTKTVGSPFLVLVVWLLAGAMALCGALCFGELAARRPEAGGGYVYLRDAYGPPLAFLYGWMGLLVLDPGLTAALAVGAASYAAYALGLSPAPAKALALALIVSLAAVNVRGVRVGGWLVGWLTVVKLALLLFIVLWGFGLRLGDWGHFQPFFAQREGSAPLAGALAGALVSAFFSFGGWWDLSKLGGEVRDPARTLPRAYTCGLLVVVAVYVLTSAVQEGAQAVVVGPRAPHDGADGRAVGEVQAVAAGVHQEPFRHAAHQLVGVTMQERGVSRLLSVDLGAAVDMVEAVAAE